MLANQRQRSRSFSQLPDQDINVIKQSEIVAN